MSQEDSQNNDNNNPYIDEELIDKNQQFIQQSRHHKGYNKYNRGGFKGRRDEINSEENDYYQRKHESDYKKHKWNKYDNDKRKYDDENNEENNTKITKQNGDVLRMTKIPKHASLNEQNIKNLFDVYKENITKFEIVEFRSHKYKEYHPCSIYIKFNSNQLREKAMEYIEGLKQNKTIHKKYYNLKYSSWKFKEKKEKISNEEREMKKEEMRRERERKKEETKRIRLEKKLEKERKKMEAKNEKLRQQKELEEQRKKWEMEETERKRKQMEQTEKEQRELRMKRERERHEKIQMKQEKENELRRKLKEEQKHLKNKITIKKLPKLKVPKMRKQKLIKKDVNNNSNKMEAKEAEEKEMFELKIDGFIDAKEREKQLLFKRAIIFVIDVSGSMSGSRINEVKKSVIPFVCNMVRNEEETAINIITFCDHVKLYENINKYDSNQLESILVAGGGTNFYVASQKLVECAMEWYKDYSIQIILMSDGKVSKDNAQKAHLHWRKFVENKYVVHHDVYPFVESIGIGLEHDADILDGFICNDEYGNYTQTKTSNEISIALNRSLMDATFRVGYKLKIECEFPFLINLYTQKTSKIYEMFVTKMEYLRRFWVFENDINSKKDNVIKLNKQEIIIEAMIGNDGEDNKDNNIEYEEEKEIINEEIIGYHYQLLRDMIDHLRQFKDEISLKNEAQKIQSKLYELKYIFGEIISNKQKINVVQTEGNQGNIIDKLDKTLNSLQFVLKKIIDGCKYTNVQEIRQDILMLHFGQ